MLNGNVIVIKISGISNTEEQSIKDFLQGAVYTWCNIKKTEKILFRNLMGGDNYFWDNTPLYCLYDKHFNICKNNDTAVTEACKDAGMLLKTVLKEDKNKTFDQDEVEEYDIPKKRYWFVS